MLLAKSRKELMAITEKLVEEAARVGLKINEEKSQYMQLKNKHYKTENRILEIKTKSGKTQTFDETESYMYLGVLINNKCEEEGEINLRLAKSNRCAGSLNKVLRSKDISRKTKVRLFLTILRPTLRMRNMDIKQESSKQHRNMGTENTSKNLRRQENKGRVGKAHK